MTTTCQVVEAQKNERETKETLDKAISFRDKIKKEVILQETIFYNATSLMEKLFEQMLQKFPSAECLGNSDNELSKMQQCNTLWYQSKKIQYTAANEISKAIENHTKQLNILEYQWKKFCTHITIVAQASDAYLDAKKQLEELAQKLAQEKLAQLEQEKLALEEFEEKHAEEVHEEMINALLQMQQRYTIKQQLDSLSEIQVIKLVWDARISKIIQQFGIVTCNNDKCNNMIFLNETACDCEGPACCGCKCNCVSGDEALRLVHTSCENVCKLKNCNSYNHKNSHGFCRQHHADLDMLKISICSNRKCLRLFKMQVNQNSMELCFSCRERS